MASRILGLLRESLFSYFLGTSEMLSALRVAMLAPGFARRLFAEGTLSAGLVPALAELERRDASGQSQRELFAAVLARACVVLLVVTVVAEGILQAWRIREDDFSLWLTQILFPYAAMIFLVGVASAALHWKRAFALPAAAPIVLNVFMIGGLLAARLYDSTSLRAATLGVSVGVLMAGVVQLAMTGFALSRFGLLGRGRFKWRDSIARGVLRASVFSALGLSVIHVSTLLDMLVAYLFIREDGERVGPAVLGYAQVLYQLPIGVLGVALATAIFPELSERAADVDRRRLLDAFYRGIRLSFFAAVPSAAGLMVAAWPLVASVYEHGSFGLAQTDRVAGALVLYSISIPAHFLQLIFVRVLYALGDARSPARTALFMILLDLVLNLLLVHAFEERGLALSSSICAVMQILWLGIVLKRRIAELRWGKVLASWWKTLVISLLMVGAVLGMNFFLRGFGPIPDAAELVILVGVGVLSFVGLAYFMCAGELKELMR